MPSIFILSLGFPVDVVHFVPYPSSSVGYLLTLIPFIFARMALSNGIGFI